MSGGRLRAAVLLLAAVPVTAAAAVAALKAGHWRMTCSRHGIWLQRRSDSSRRSAQHQQASMSGYGPCVHQPPAPWQSGQLGRGRGWSELRSASPSSPSSRSRTT
ncbi:hypothetical protein ABT173_45810 [Streptomyces sp. NPDC001795]|uniref:hypothetical protein n=1 Tax=Streptomyces sp. NPDC001795 TaxID=3154525 RepID=UPI003325419C